MFLLLQIYDVPGTVIPGLKLKNPSIPRGSPLSSLIKRFEYRRRWALGRPLTKQQLLIYKDESAVQRSVQTLTHTCRLLPVILENVPAQFNEIWFQARRLCCKADESLMGALPGKIVRK